MFVRNDEYSDTVLTLYKQNIARRISASVGTTQLEQMENANQINEAFDTTIALANGDSVVTGKVEIYRTYSTQTYYSCKKMHGKINQ